MNRPSPERLKELRDLESVPKNRVYMIGATELLAEIDALKEDVRARQAAIDQIMRTFELFQEQLAKLRSQTAKPPGACL